ncbi:transposase [Chitinophaga ginsengisoli]|uniref:DDE family transposase n=1 Tax=Chitinophaga ginsengisoli TaxID=363837 RepID=A0A2P8F682_9BACT|nr:transposase [Chitinophaga ginsengisoli]PSL17226.1 DDE family transposase [Chitinophaga ginsengisoli]
MTSTNLYAFSKVKHLVDAILNELSVTTKPQYKFMISLFEVWLGLPVRYTILNLSRFGNYCEKSIRLHMEQQFDFISFNKQLIKHSCHKELIAAFDPTYISKSGNHTPGLGKWWSGSENRAKKGLELGCLAIVDVAAGTAMPLKGVQTPGRKVLKEKNWTSMDHYIDVVKSQLPALMDMVKYLTVDGYFMKKDFINPIVKSGLHVITKMRPDANLRYLYTGPRKKGRGRPKLYDDKVNCSTIDKRRIREFQIDNDAIYYSGVVYSIGLQKKVRIVYIEHRITGKYEILLSTDTTLCPESILKYYRLRFQIEFLIRDAKQFAGLEDCQARSANKLDFHFNMALTTVAIAKATTWLNLPQLCRGPFSMRNVKVAYYNKFMTDRIFSTLGLDLNCKKIKRLYHKCLNTAELAA